VIILDADNEVAAIYNLNEHDLSVGEDYDALKDLLRGAAQETGGL
jgi:hypothetical protein